jgi:hypothetical protein
MLYKYQSNFTGEVVSSLKEVMKSTFSYIRSIPFEWKMLSWSYNKRGW